MSNIIYKNGLKTKVFCARCGNNIDATIYQKRARWIAELKCVHGMKVMGYVAPPDELVKRGLITKESDNKSIIESRNAAHREWERDIKERMEWANRQ